jgi:integrase
LPSADRDVADLTVRLLVARSGTTFGRGFRLKVIGRRLYVQMAGRKVPLHLELEAEPAAVQERALQLRRFCRDRPSGFCSEAWRDACAVERVRTGKPLGGRKGRPRLDEVMTQWQRLKAAEGVSASTIERHYLGHLRRLDERDPLGEDSLLRAIEATDPQSPTRRRVVAFLRRLCALHGIGWNGALLDPLQQSGRGLRHRPQAFFSDGQIEAMLVPAVKLSGSWRRVVALLAIYGLRPWEAWTATPSTDRPGCAWVPQGKTNRHGTTPPRLVPPFHPEWLESFGMQGLWDRPLPALSDLGRAGARVNQQLRRAGLASAKGATSYGFRHAYARRLHSPRYRVTDTHASLFMGHTVAAHHGAYRSWMGGEDPVEMYLPGLATMGLQGDC